MSDEPNPDLCSLFESAKGFFCPKCQPALATLAESLAVYNAALIQSLPADQAEILAAKKAVAVERRALIRHFTAICEAIREKVNAKRAFLEQRLAEATDDDQREWWGLQLQDLDYFDQTGQAIEAQLALMGVPLQFGDEELDK